MLAWHVLGVTLILGRANLAKQQGLLVAPVRKNAVSHELGEGKREEVNSSETVG